jgi:hypothetical protein
MMVPEGRKYRPVAQQQPDLLRKALPHRTVNPVLTIETDEQFEIGVECAALVGQLVVELGRIGRDETDPEEYETYVGISGFGLGPSKPAERAMNTKPHVFWEGFADAPLFFLQSSE